MDTNAVPVRFLGDIEADDHRGRLFDFLRGAWRSLLHAGHDLGHEVEELRAKFGHEISESVFAQDADHHTLHAPEHPKSGRPPTANKVAFATGLNWSDISKVRSAPRATAAKKLLKTREQSPSKAARVIEGWMKDPAFLTSSGYPSDLPIRRLGKHRSFKDLVAKYAPSTPFGTLLKELTRRGHVQVLDGEIVRFKRATAQRGGMTPAAIADASQKVKRLADNLYKGLQDQNAANIYEEGEPLKLSEKQAALIRPLLERRIKAFLKSVENEFREKDDSEPGERKDFGVSVYSWKDESRAPAQADHCRVTQ